MGYDMYWIKKPEGEEEAVAAARIIWDAAIHERDQIPREESGRWNRAAAERLGDWEAHEAYEGRTERYAAAQDKVWAASAEMDKARRSYFRLNIHGMGIYRDLMDRFGMVFDDIPHPDWPKADDYGVTNEQVWATENPEDYPEEFASLTPEDMEKVNAVLAEKTRVLAWHGNADTPGIPFHKFSSNDGWLVLPAECEAAVRIWEMAVKERGEDSVLAEVERFTKNTDYWLAWIEYLRGAARHGGFEVW